MMIARSKWRPLKTSSMLSMPVCLRSVFDSANMTRPRYSHQSRQGDPSGFIGLQRIFAVRWEARLHQLNSAAASRRRDSLATASDFQDRRQLEHGEELLSEWLHEHRHRTNAIFVQRQELEGVGVPTTFCAQGIEGERWLQVCADRHETEAAISGPNIPKKSLMEPRP